MAEPPYLNSTESPCRAIQLFCLALKFGIFLDIAGSGSVWECGHHPASDEGRTQMCSENFSSIPNSQQMFTPRNKHGAAATRNFSQQVCKFLRTRKALHRKSPRLHAPPGESRSRPHPPRINSLAAIRCTCSDSLPAAAPRPRALRSCSRTSCPRSACPCFRVLAAFLLHE